MSSKRDYYEALGVGRSEGIGDLYGVLEGLADGDGPSSDRICQGPAVHEFHGDEVDAVNLVDVVDVNNIGMIDCRGRLGFLHEAPLPIRVGYGFCWQNLDRDIAVQVRVAGLVDHAHAALTELFGERVVPYRLADH